MDDPLFGLFCRGAAFPTTAWRRSGRTDRNALERVAGDRATGTGSLRRQGIPTIPKASWSCGVARFGYP